MLFHNYGRMQIQLTAKCITKEMVINLAAPIEMLDRLIFDVFADVFYLGGKLFRL